MGFSIRLISSVLAAVLALAAPAIGATRTVEQAYIPSQGGLNTKANPLGLPQGDITEARNVEFDIAGAWATRKGFAKHNSTVISGTPTVTSLFEWVQSDGTRSFLATASDGAIYESVSGTWTSRATGLTTGENQVNWVNWKGTDVIACNGQNQAQHSTDATTWAALADPPAGETTCKLIEVHRGRAWLVPKNSNTVYYSSADTIQFDAGATDGSIVVGDNTEGFITGLHSHLGVLLVFKQRAIHVISGSSPSDFAVAPLVSGVGAETDETIRTVHGPSGTDVFFASQTGVHSLAATDAFGDFKASLVSSKITPTWNGLNKSRLNKMSAVYIPVQSQYWISGTTSGQTQNDTILKYDMATQSWATMEGANAFALGLRQDSNGEQEVYHGDFGGFVYEHHSGYNDAGSAYTSQVTTAWLHLGNPGVKKTLQELTIFYEPKGEIPLTVSYLVDFNLVDTKTFNMTGGGTALGSFVLGTDTLGGDTAIASKRLSLRRAGIFAQFKFTNSSADKDFRIYGYTVKYLMREEE